MFSVLPAWGLFKLQSTLKRFNMNTLINSWGWVYELLLKLSINEMKISQEFFHPFFIQIAHVTFSDCVKGLNWTPLGDRFKSKDALEVDFFYLLI